MGEKTGFNSLKEIFLKFSEIMHTPWVGEETHAKIVPTFGYCTIEYNEYDMYEDRRDNLISYSERMVKFSVREAGLDDHNHFSYTVRRAYLEEHIEFLKTVDSGLARILVDAEFMDSDEKNTEMTYSFGWDNYDDVYILLLEYVKKSHAES